MMTMLYLVLFILCKLIYSYFSLVTKLNTVKCDNSKLLLWEGVTAGLEYLGAGLAVNKTKISVQHWCQVSRRNKMKISVSLCLCLLLLLCFCHCCWLACSSKLPRLHSLPMVASHVSWPNICMTSAPNYPYVLDMMVCYLPTLQNLASLNPDEHIPLWSSDHNSQLGSFGDDICVRNWHVLHSGRAA